MLLLVAVLATLVFGVLFSVFWMGWLVGHTQTKKHFNHVLLEELRLRQKHERCRALYDSPPGADFDRNFLKRMGIR